MSASGGVLNPSDGYNIIRMGYMRKLKTARRKWFVLRRETPDAQARLEYYDSEKKYQSGCAPKRVIPLKTCFNINLLQDSKRNKIIALYTKDECLTLGVDDFTEDGWIKDLLSLQQGEELSEGDVPRPMFAHVWQVTVVNRGLGTQGLIGNYRLCLTEEVLSLVRLSEESTQIDINLSNIRSCGSLKNFIFLEVGRSCSIGDGELWMETEDHNIAKNVHSIVYHAMSKSGSRDELGPKSRIRSSSATESSKPNSNNKKQYSKAHSILSQVSGMVTIYHHLRGSTKSSERRHSISGCVTLSGNVCHQRTQSLSLANPAPPSDNNPLSQHARVNKRTNQPSKCLSAGRERCDSMPSRARTASEGNHAIPMYPSSRSHLSHRPISVHREMGHSPPGDFPLISPPSIGASTDSAGSSYSLADENEDGDTLGRYGHSLTPDEAIAEEECDGMYNSYGASPCANNYMQMAPPSSDDGYVDMSPKGRHSNITPAASLSSVTSGTPSTDMRFAEYQLDKVSSFLTASDDEGRPIRAYSVGSRPQYKTHMVDIHPTVDNRRDRASSVGSKNKKGPVRVLPPHGHYNHAGPKSSSAPLLSNSRLPSSSNSSMRDMDDLMEMDFTKATKTAKNQGYVEVKPATTPKSSSSNSGYVEMKLGVNPGNVSLSNYVDMKTPGTSPGKSSDYTFVDLNKQYPITMPEPRNDYMDMDPRVTFKMKYSSSPGTNYTNVNDYTEMNHHLKRSFSQASASPMKVSVSPKLGVGSPSSDYLDMQVRNAVPKPQEVPTKTPDGYVEMSIGKGHHRQSSLDNSHLNKTDDYSIMAVTSVLQKKPSKKDSNKSLPITILNSNQNATTGNSPIYTSLNQKTSNSPIYTTMGSREGTHWMNLPLTSPNSSLPRNSGKNSRRDSRDSSSSSVTTPSGSSTIFPLSLNSPSSPIKPTKTPENSFMKIPAAIRNTVYKASNRLSGKSIKDNDYMVMNFDKNKTNNMDTSEYVNFSPAFSTSPKAAALVATSDYALMKPCPAPSRYVVTPKSSSLESNLSLMSLTEARGFKPISEQREDRVSPAPQLNESVPHSLDKADENDRPYEKLRAGECVSPSARSNSVNSDNHKNNSNANEKTRSVSVNSDVCRTNSRPGSATSEICSSTSTLVGSRPDSVNSDTIRPASSTSGSLLHYASLDLQIIDDDGSKSPRTVKNCSSDTVGVTGEPKFGYAQIDFNKSKIA